MTNRYLNKQAAIQFADVYMSQWLVWLIYFLHTKVDGAYMGPTWGRQDPSGPHVGPMILAIWDHPKVLYGEQTYYRLEYDKDILRAM